MTTQSLPHMANPMLHIRQIDIDAPTRWVTDGWQDFKSAPIPSLLWGGLFVLAGWGLLFGLYALDLGSLIPAAIAAFFLGAPVLAVGMLDVSRRLEQKQPVSFALTTMAWRRNLTGLMGIGLVLMLAVTAWAQVALLTFMMFFHSGPPPVDHFIYGLLTSPMALPFLVVGTGLGGIIALVTFAISALSVPLLLDRDLPVAEAIALSVNAVRDNRRVMASWAATILVLIGFGFVTSLLGLVLTLPLVAYGSWHAYRDLVE